MYRRSFIKYGLKIPQSLPHYQCCGIVAGVFQIPAAKADLDRREAPRPIPLVRSQNDLREFPEDLRRARQMMIKLTQARLSFRAPTPHAVA